MKVYDSTGFEIINGKWIKPHENDGGEDSTAIKIEAITKIEAKKKLAIPYSARMKFDHSYHIVLSVNDGTELTFVYMPPEKEAFEKDKKILEELILK